MPPRRHDASACLPLTRACLRLSPPLQFKLVSGQTREKIYSQLVSSLDMLTLHKETLETQLLSLKKHVATKMDTLSPLLDDTIEVQ